VRALDGAADGAIASVFTLEQGGGVAARRSGGTDLRACHWPVS
jgi:hypothetical protein